MNARTFYYPAIATFLLLGFTPSFSQSWKGLMKKASGFEIQHDTINAALYAEKAFNKAKVQFKTTDALYKQSLDLYVKTAVRLLDKTGVKGNPDYVSELHELSKLYIEAGDENQADTLIAECRKNEIGYIQNADISWEDLTKKAKEYGEKADFELSKAYAEKAVAKAESVYGNDHPNYATALNDLGVLNFITGNYEVADTLYKQAAKIQKINPGQEHPDYAITLCNQAELLSQVFDFASAEPLYIQALKIQEKALGKNNAAYAKTLSCFAKLNHQLGKFDIAVPLYSEAIGIQKKYISENPLEYVTTLIGIGMLNMDMSKPAEAGPFFLEALEIQAKIIGKNHPDYAATLCYLGIFNQISSHFEEAESLYKQAMEIIAKTLTVKHPSYQYTASSLANLYWEMGNYSSAAGLIKEYLPIKKEALGETNIDYATVLCNLGTLYKYMGYYNTAEPYLKKGMELTKNAVPQVPNHYANSLNNLAMLYCSMGRYTAAEPLYKEAIEIRKKVLGENHGDYAKSLSNFGVMYKDLGNYAAAEELLQKSLQIFKNTQGEDSPDYEVNLSNLASLYASMGDVTKAGSYYKKSLEITQRIFNEKHPDYISSLSGLADLFKETGDYSKAEPLYLQALDLCRQDSRDKDPEYASMLTSLSGLYQKMGNYQASEPICIQALSIIRDSLGVDHPYYARSLNDLAGIFLSDGKIPEAESKYKEAMEIFKKSMGTKNPNYALSLKNLTAFYMASGNSALAEKYLLESNQIFLEQLREGYQFLSEKEALLYLKSIGSQFEISNSFVSVRRKTNPALAELSFNTELGLKGASLQSSLFMRQAIQESHDSILVETYKGWVGLKEQINLLKNTPKVKRFADVDSLETEANSLEKNLIRKSQVFGDMKASIGIQWKDVQGRLSENEAAIEFISFRYHNGREFTDSTLYAALIIRPRYEYPQFINLFNEKDLYNILYDTDAPKDRPIRKNITPEIMQEIYKLAWKPLEEYLTGVTTVSLATSGLLTTIPFQALMKTSTSCLIDSMNIHYLLSTREIALEKPIKESEEPLTATLFGGINYDLDTSFLLREAMRSGSEVTRSFIPGDGTRGLNSFNYLPGTRTEVQLVNSYLTSHNWKTRKFTDSLATEGEFKRLSGKNATTILHIATHGFYNPPVMTKEIDFSLSGTDQPFRFSDNPLMRTGLIMAGGNLAWQRKPLPDGVEDGILTAYEISNLDLRKTSLVVLSACETGLGDIKAGEGTFGLQRAFRLAGVKTIIMSLWKVSDKTTSELMSKFFGYASAGEERVTAFNHAVTDLRKKYPDEPGKWAAFIIVR